MRFIGRYQNLLNTINKYKPKTILEVGTWNGRHALGMFQTAKKYQPKVNYFGYDLFEDFNAAVDEYCPKKPAYVKDVQKLFSPYDAIIIKGDTRKTLYSHPPTLPIDFAFIDGGHALETINSDWNGVRPHLHKDSVVLFDDYYVRKDLAYTVGCRTLIEELEKTGYKVTILNPVDTCNGGTCMVKVTLNEFQSKI